MLISTFFFKKLNACTEFSDKGEKTLQIITLIEKLNVTLLNAENKKPEFLAGKMRELEKKKSVIEESRLILNEIQNKINKSDLQYETFIKLKHSIYALKRCNTVHHSMN